MSSATETPSISLSPLCEKRCCRNDSGSGSGAIDNEQLHTLFTQLLYKLLGVDMRAASAQEVFRALRCSTQVSSFSVKTAYSGAMRASLCSMYVAQIAVLPRVFCYRRGRTTMPCQCLAALGIEGELFFPRAERSAWSYYDAGKRPLRMARNSAGCRKGEKRLIRRRRDGPRGLSGLFHQGKKVSYEPSQRAGGWGNLFVWLGPRSWSGIRESRENLLYEGFLLQPFHRIAMP